MRIVLIPGLWLDGSAWDAVLPGLRAAGHDPVAVTLPGQGDGAASATLDDQLDAVLAAIDAGAGPALVVGHSAAATLAWLAADRRPGRVARVAFIGGMPTPDGQAYAPWFTSEDGQVPFVGWDVFAGPDSDDLTDEQKASIAAGAHPVPDAVAQGIVRYGNPARYAVPAVEICPEFSPDDARAWMAAGDAPELAAIEHLDLVDLDSGHWPMVSAPDALAALLVRLA